MGRSPSIEALYLDQPQRLMPSLRSIHHYIETTFAPLDPRIRSALYQAELARLPSIHISPLIGHILTFFIHLTTPRKILEIGTLAAISTLWIAYAMPQDGHITTLEKNSHYAAIAKKNISQAGLSSSITLKQGEAKDLLQQLEGPFDLFFFDADRENYPFYLDWALDHAQPGALIITDNILRNGKVANPKDPSIEALAHYNQLLANHPLLETIPLPTFGGLAGGAIDGLAVSRYKKS